MAMRVSVEMFMRDQGFLDDGRWATERRSRTRYSCILLRGQRGTARQFGLRLPQRRYFGLQGFVFGFFPGQVIAGQQRTVPDALGRQEVRDLGKLAAAAAEVRHFEQAFFDQGGDQIVNLPIAYPQLMGKVPLRDFRVLFDCAKNLKMDLIFGGHRG